MAHDVHHPQEAQELERSVASLRGSGGALYGRFVGRVISPSQVAQPTTVLYCQLYDDILYEESSRVYCIQLQ